MKSVFRNFVDEPDYWHINILCYNDCMKNSMKREKGQHMFHKMSPPQFSSATHEYLHGTQRQGDSIRKGPFYVIYNPQFSILCT